MAEKTELNKPMAKPMRPAEPAKKLFDESSPSRPAPSGSAPEQPGVVTIQFQRARAKEMQQYFQDQKLQAAVEKSKVFGWTEANEIGNGRWVMFGLLVGVLTEVATGVDFPNQLRLMFSYLGIVDLE